MRESFFNEQIRQYFEEDKLAEAAVYCAAILPQIRDTCGEGIQDVAHVLNNIARAYYYLGDYSAAPEATKTLGQNRLRAERCYLRVREWDRAITLVGKAQVHDIKREFGQAERLLRADIELAPAKFFGGIASVAAQPTLQARSWTSDLSYGGVAEEVFNVGVLVAGEDFGEGPAVGVRLTVIEEAADERRLHVEVEHFAGGIAAFPAHTEEGGLKDKKRKFGNVVPRPML